MRTVPAVIIAIALAAPAFAFAQTDAKKRTADAYTAIATVRIEASKRCPLGKDSASELLALECWGIVEDGNALSRVLGSRLSSYLVGCVNNTGKRKTGDECRLYREFATTDLTSDEEKMLGNLEDALTEIRERPIRAK